MWKLINHTSRNEKGAVSTIFAIVFASGILFLAFAITSDASALYFERRSLQNAADATSLAIASNCALGSVYCKDETSTKNEAQIIANANSPDGFSSIKIMCGTTPLSACTTTPVVECKSVASNVPAYGRIVLSTKNADGTDKVKSPFFNYLIGNSNSEVNVNSCSQTAWGKANSADIPVPIVISICDYLTDGYKLIQEYSEQLLQCPSSIRDVQGNLIPPPQKVINGWAMYRPYGQQLLCLISRKIVVGDLLETLPPGQESCKDISGSDSKSFLKSFISSNLKKKIFIPVIAGTSGSGNGNAQIVSSNSIGFFTFVFLGFDFGPNVKGGCGDPAYKKTEPECAQIPTSEYTNCTNSSKRGCIWGRFTRGIVPGVSVSRDTFPSVGAQAVELLP